MKEIQWSDHALEAVAEREIDRAEVEKAVVEPEAIAECQEGRRVYMRRYDDPILEQKMLLRVVVEETDKSLTVVTVYKVSRIDRYLTGDSA
jgi:Domain of unknown function (DUF4258)